MIRACSCRFAISLGLAGSLSVPLVMTTMKFVLPISEARSAERRCAFISSSSSTGLSRIGAKRS